MNAQMDRVLDALSDGAKILDDTEAFIRRFCVLPDENAYVAVTLWAAHTHLIESFVTTPRLALLSPEPASGKTRVLEVLGLLVHEQLMAISASPASIFRMLDQSKITLLFDEVDTIFRKRGKDDSNEDLRALLNAGYKQGASIPRCVGKDYDVTLFDVFCPVALAGLGDLPDTIMTRSLVVRMRRRSPSERVESFRYRLVQPEGQLIRDRLNSWAGTVASTIESNWPDMPNGVEDRAAEVWEPLLMVADAAGGRWPAG